jgi:patatin-related protein
VEETVDRLFGHTFFLDRPTPKRLAGWRTKAQQAALQQAGFAYHGYAQVKFSGVLSMLARMINEAVPEHELSSTEPIVERLLAHLARHGLDRMLSLRDGASATMIAFFRAHDIAFRVRRLRFLARRVTQDWEKDESVTEQDRDDARAAIYGALALYFEREPVSYLGDDFAPLARNFFTDPGAAIDHIADRRALPEVDERVDLVLSETLAQMPPTLRRRVLLTYLGFPFYDTVTLPLLRGEGMTEFDPIKVDRISPEDCYAIRKGGAPDTLRGSEFYNFGAFFSRAYRENDYLWGRLHGAERMIDLIASTLESEHEIPVRELDAFKREAFLAILEEEQDRLRADPGLVERIRNEVLGSAEVTR